MTFHQINERRYDCVSDSGSRYELTARPIPDEFDSAMRCGIAEDDPFVAAIPLLWSCSCPAGRNGRDCKHVRSLLRDVLGSPSVPSEADVAARRVAQRAAQRQAQADAEAAAERAAAARAASRANYERVRELPECRAHAVALVYPTTDPRRVQLRADADVQSFFLRWGFCEQTRIEAVARMGLGLAAAV
jgi:uncharacterized protein (DUF4415 family)